MKIEILKMIKYYKIFKLDQNKSTTVYLWFSK